MILDSSDFNGYGYLYARSTTAIAKGNHKAGEIQEQTCQHSRLINLPGMKQIYIGVNKMDCDTAAYKQTRHDEIANDNEEHACEGWTEEGLH